MKTRHFKTVFLIIAASVAHLLFFIDASADQYGDIVVDGDLSDWSAADQINLPLDRPPTLNQGMRLYGKYSPDQQVYLLALDANGVSIGPNTTFWLNIDQNSGTGYQIWGAYGGAEYFVNIYSDSNPHLYSSTFAWMGGPLVHAYSVDDTVLELAVPATSLPPLTPQQDIDLLGDLNDVEFLFPQDYASGNQYTIRGAPEVLPPRTDPSKRIGIVYGSTTKDLFFGERAYSQLFMSMQHQAMMAGIPFDLLTQDDLRDITNLVNYDALIFPYFAFVPEEIRNEVHDTLFKAVYYYGIGIITADNWITNDENGGPVPDDSYRYMKQLLGVGRVDGYGPVDITVSAKDISHPVMSGYAPDELIIGYDDNWYNYFSGVPGQSSIELSSEVVTGPQAGTYPAMIATETGARHVHFASIGLLADTNLVWQALQWVVYGDQTAVGLKMGRNRNLFFSRNDMDQAQEHDEVLETHLPLLALITDWKNNYNFVGSYFIDIGNDPQNGQWTDWMVSAPIFQDYVDLGNEIGTHSWTHPHDTNALSPTEIEFEFNQSMNEIATQIGPTWNGQAIRGGAVPGAGENLATTAEIVQYLDYLTGGYSGVGAGYPSAFGYVEPGADKVYLSPNMFFDFTLMEWGVPVGNPPVPVPLTAVEAEQYWQAEYDDLMSHASQPIILWSWHDYGPTTSADPFTGDGYSVAMYENTIAMASSDGAEFVTSADLVDRIGTFRAADFHVDQLTPSTIRATVTASNVGKFSLVVPGQVIQDVDGWYAYSQDKVFLDDDGGIFDIALGGSPSSVTRITDLPMRSRLINLTGTGTNLSFTFEGEGQVRVALNGDPTSFNVAGADSVSILGENEIGLNFNGVGTHSASVALGQ